MEALPQDPARERHPPHPSFTSYRCTWLLDDGIIASPVEFHHHSCYAVRDFNVRRGCASKRYIHERFTMVEAVREQQATGAEHVVWDLSVFYSGVDDPAIEADMQSIREEAQAFAATYRENVGTLDPRALAAAMEAYAAIHDRVGRIGTFAELNYATDTANPRFGALVQKFSEFAAEVNQRLVFFRLEWNALADDDAARVITGLEQAHYRHYMEALRRFSPHQLSEAEEQIIVEKDVTGRMAWLRFFSQLMGAARYDFDGQALTQSQILEKLRVADRDVRARAAESITRTLQSKQMELTFIFNVLAADKSLSDRRRQYETWVSSRNLSNKVPDDVVEALVGAVTANYDIVAQHYDLKRAILGLDALLDYDRYAPLPTRESDKFYTWDEAREIVLNAFYAFSPRIGDVAKRFFDEHWIHAAPLPNKRSGAFAAPTVPSAHPFIFLTYLGKADNVMTLAHELGHGIHMALSGEAHGFWGLYTPLTTAEMASVFAEMLVFQDLRSREADPEVRLAMLASKIEDTFSTVFRQVAMNRFEHAMHTARRTEGELPAERLDALWAETQRAMFGDSVTLRDDYAVWWRYIPHFLQTPGYVYAYAFGELLVLALYRLFEERGADFVPQYEAVLAAGDSDWPHEILRKVGVDLNDPAFWNGGLQAIRALVEEEAALARQVFPQQF